MSMDLVLKPSCGGCGSAGELYGTTCKHLTLCVSCGRTMAENGAACYECGTPITRLIREYNVRACSNNDKNYFIGRFVSGLPNFSKKKSENKWSLQKEGLMGRQVTDLLREKFKNKAWLLEDEIGAQFHGQPEGAQSAIYYLLMMQGKEFVAIPAGSWYTFSKVAQYKQLTLEEAEEKMKNRRKTADGFERWLMKAANNGAAAFGEVERFDEKEVGSGSGRGKKKTGTDDDEGRASDRGEEDVDEEAARKNRLGLNKKGGGDDEEGLRGGDLDMDDDDIEKGDDWEHEEIFTDDDERVGDPDEHEDLAPEIPPPPEIKQDDDDDEEGDEEEGGGLSKSGKELKKLLGRANGLNESDGDDDDDDEDSDDDIPAVLAPTKQQKEAPKEEPTENINPLKSNAPGSSRGTATTSKSSKGKRKLNGDESKSSNDAAPQKKVKSENDVKPMKEENTSNATTKNNVHSKTVSPQTSAKTHSKTGTPQTSTKNGSSSSSVQQATGPVTEDEIRAMLPPKTQVTTQDLVAKFKSRLKTKEDKDAFADILKKISKIQNVNGKKIIVLREK